MNPIKGIMFVLTAIKTYSAFGQAAFGSVVQRIGLAVLNGDTVSADMNCRKVSTLFYHGLAGVLKQKSNILK